MHSQVSAQELIDEITEYYGIKGFTLMLNENISSMDFVYRFDEVDFASKDSCFNSIKKLFKGLEDSVFVKRLRESYEDELGMLAARVKDLEKYKTYYDLAKGMRGTT